MKERLTEKTENGGVKYEDRNGYYHICYGDTNPVHALARKLAELEDMLENGELVSKDWHDEQVLHLQEENERLSLIAGIVSKGVAVEIVNMQETIDKQNTEIERLTEELKNCGQELIESNREQEELQDRNAELQKKVDEQDKEIDRLEKVVHEQAEQYYDCEQRTAKEILQRIMNIIKKSDGFLCEEAIRIMAKQNDVEVDE